EQDVGAGAGYGLGDGGGFTGECGGHVGVEPPPLQDSGIGARTRAGAGVSAVTSQDGSATGLSGTTPRQGKNPQN
ncbi:MAG: hypothetical protein ACRDU4_15035, partial [Mycobacterium sp.]